MKQKLFTLTSAFAVSASLSAPVLAEKNAISPIEPEDCTTLLEKGEASWYGDEVAKGRDEHGNLIFNDTASGEPFNPDLLTAAYPDKSFLGEYLLVAKGKENVIVRVNDYGPFAKDEAGNNRVIDLAEAAAKRLNMDGVAQVRVYLCT